MMVQDDYIDATLPEPIHGGNGRGPAVHRQQESGGKFLEAIFDPVPAQPISFIQAAREVTIDLPAQRRQNFAQERG